LTIEHDIRGRVGTSIIGGGRREELHDVTVREKSFVKKFLANCEHLTYFKKKASHKNEIKKLIVDRIEPIQTPIESAMSGLFKECINQKSIF